MTAALPTSRPMRRTALIASLAACGMFGLAFAGYPLYSMFCKRSGYGGTPTTATKEQAAAAEHALGKPMRIRFNTDVDDNMGWTFAPEKPFVDERIGETVTTYFVAKNLTDKPETGMATFNVAPDQADGRIIVAHLGYSAFATTSVQWRRPTVCSGAGPTPRPRQTLKPRWWWYPPALTNAAVPRLACGSKPRMSR